MQYGLFKINKLLMLHCDDHQYLVDCVTFFLLQSISVKFEVGVSLSHSLFPILESSKKSLGDQQPKKRKQKKEEVSGCSFYNHKKFNEFKEHLLVFLLFLY